MNISVYKCRDTKHINQFHSQLERTDLSELPKELSWVFSHRQHRWKVESLHCYQSTPQFLWKKKEDKEYRENDKFSISSGKKKGGRLETAPWTVDDPSAPTQLKHTHISTRHAGRKRRRDWSWGPQQRGDARTLVRLCLVETREGDGQEVQRRGRTFRLRRGEEGGGGG